MKNLRSWGMALSMIGLLFFSIRFEVLCWKYTKIYNLINNAHYWLPAVICFIIFIYFYLKSDKRR